MVVMVVFPGLGDRPDGVPIRDLDPTLGGVFDEDGR
jgi:hypothetical protein